jgi:hypothetical protein
MAPPAGESGLIIFRVACVCYLYSRSIFSGEWIVVPSAVKRPAERERWSSTRFVLFAFTFNALCLLVLLANLLTGNAWWKVAVPIAVVCLLFGGLAGFLARRLRLKER